MKDDDDEFDWLDANCYDLCCEAVQGQDDADIIWIVYSHHMAEPKRRPEGYGDCAKSAIRDAMLPKGDPRRSDYVPPFCNECHAPESICECKKPTAEELTT